MTSIKIVYPRLWSSDHKQNKPLRKHWLAGEVEKVSFELERSVE